MNFRDFLKRNGAWIGFLALAVILTLLTEGGFLTPRNLTNLIRQTAINGILAAGMTLVILTGGIDLSIGSIVALAGIVGGLSQVNWGWGHFGDSGAVGTVLLCIFSGGLIGLVNGGLIAWLRIPPFVITLGMMVIARGLALILSDGSGIAPMGESLLVLGEGYVSPTLTAALSVGLMSGFLWLKTREKRGWIESVIPLIVLGWIGYSFVVYKGFPYPALFLVGTLLGCSVLLNLTTLGRSVYASGSNEQAAFFAGVPIRKVKWAVYTMLGLLSGLAAVLLNARLNSAAPTAGQLFELDAIAAVVIGGTSLKGGVGTITGAFVGALTIATLNNGMDLLNVPSFYQMVLKGVIIILAVSLDRGQRES